MKSKYKIKKFPQLKDKIIKYASIAYKNGALDSIEISFKDNTKLRIDGAEQNSLACLLFGQDFNKNLDDVINKSLL